MTRFKRDLSERVGRDLGQIADQATPSSTAWEAIQQRVDEQDTTATTMEVIMLDPDTHQHSKRFSTRWLAAASVATIAVIGGLIALANRDGESVPVDQPEPTVLAADPEPEVVDGEGLEPAPDVTTQATEFADSSGEETDLSTQGSLTMACANGTFEPDPDYDRFVSQDTCEVSGADVQPFGEAQAFESSLFELIGIPGRTPGGPTIVALSDNAMMTAGLDLDDLTRFVGIAEGVDQYAGEPVFFTGRFESFGGSTAEGIGEWWTTEGARPSFADEEVLATIDVVCEPEGPGPNSSTAGYMCSYGGADADRFVAEAEFWNASIVPADFGPTTEGPNSVLGSDFVVGTAAKNAVGRAGIITGGAEIRWVGLRKGIGEFEGSLIAEDAWVSFDDPGSETSAFRGVIQLSFVPED